MFNTEFIFQTQKGPLERHAEQHLRVKTKGPNNKPSPSVSLPVLRMGTLGNYEPRGQQPKHVGLGEFGVGVKWDAAKKAEFKESIKEYGFNVALSDQISLDRAAPDIRDTQ